MGESDGKTSNFYDLYFLGVSGHRKYLRWLVKKIILSPATSFAEKIKFGDSNFIRKECRCQVFAGKHFLRLHIILALLSVKGSVRMRVSN